MTARRAAVLGSPIAHSRSPILHRAAYAALGLPWEYSAVEVDEAGLSGFLDSLDESWVGLSLTMPLKTAVLPLLDESTDLVQSVGAANTVVFRDGRRIGHNTDVPGAVRALRETGVAAVQEATILGAGATARSTLAALGALGAADVTLAARRPEAAAEVATLADRLGVRMHVVALADMAAVAHALTRPVVVSTVPGGAADHLAAEVPASPGVLLDVAYSPWPTGLAAAWQARGGAVASGFDLLLWQAVDQVELMTGLPAPVDAMAAALAAAR